MPDERNAVRDVGPFRRLFVRGLATMVSCLYPLGRVLLMIVFGSTAEEWQYWPSDQLLQPNPSPPNPSTQRSYPLGEMQYEN